MRERNPVRLSRVLRTFWVGSAVLFVLLFVVREAERAAGFPVGFYHFLGVRFTDLLEYRGTFGFLHTAAFYRNPVTPSVAYPPVGALLYAVLYATGRPVLAYLLLALAWLGMLWWSVSRKLREEGIGTAVAMGFVATVLVASFPILGLLQAGNLELFVWMLTASGVWLLVSGRDDEAAAAWGLAAGIKLYPVIFLVLLLGRRRWRAFGVGVSVFLLASVVAMLWMGPSLSVAWHGSLANVFGYQGKRVGEWNLHELAANHSAFGLVKFLATIVGASTAKWTLPYYVAGAVVFAAAYFGRLRKMPLANQVLGVSVFMVMLPPVSYFYTLVHLYAPWLMLMLVAERAEKTGEVVPGLRGTLMLFLPLFASFTLMTFPKVFLFGGLVQGAVLVMLFFCALMFPFGISNSHPQSIEA